MQKQTCVSYTNISIFPGVVALLKITLSIDGESVTAAHVTVVCVYGHIREYNGCGIVLNNELLYPALPTLWANNLTQRYVVDFGVLCYKQLITQGKRLKTYGLLRLLIVLNGETVVQCKATITLLEDKILFMLMSDRRLGMWIWPWPWAWPPVKWVVKYNMTASDVTFLRVTNTSSIYKLLPMTYKQKKVLLLILRKYKTTNVFFYLSFAT
jgi:hypothetical protein